MCDYNITCDIYMCGYNVYVIVYLLKLSEQTELRHSFMKASLIKLSEQT